MVGVQNLQDLVVRALASVVASIKQSPLRRLKIRVLELPEFKGEHIGLRV